MPPLFFANSTLLNPKFNGYKLKILEQENCVSNFPLPPPSATQSTVSARRIIPFTEVSARIKHNHLYIGPDGPVYVDQSGKVVLIKLDDTYKPSFHTIFELPQEVSRVKSDDGEYPVALGVGSARWLVSDGHGRFYVFGMSAPSGETCSFELVDQAGSLVPCRLVHIREIEVELVALVTRRVAEDNTSDSKSKTPSLYDLVALCLNPRSSEITELWSLRGTSLPADVQFDPATNAYIVSAASVFYPAKVPEPVEPVPSKDEIAPIPRADENLDAEPVSTHVPPPHAYSWTQTDDSVTILFPLPSTTPKSAIRTTITKSHLTLNIITPGPASVPVPKYAQCPWWADVDPGASLWTWERAPDGRESNVGLLTLHLEKKHVGTRWSSVFAQSSGEPEVSETLDPSELASIREALEKYTAEFAGGDSSMPSLANPDADEELDAPGQVGQTVSVTRIDAVSGHVDVDQREVSVLSMPIPIAQIGERAKAPSLIVRRDIDGLLFEFEPCGEKPPAWTHTSTFPALSFVLASKRDTRFVLHHQNRLVLAFESGSTHGTGNVYIYRGQEGTVEAQWSFQSILPVSSQATGALLGVAMVRCGGDDAVICCLCERQLVVLRDIV
ncbi:NudC domain containing protein [Ceratobasidium theobromae]|uniref:NudC domain-containing protein 1 n=1 Tax=Ceratobasidium theobromae TaxID=1582974 RepID=A0A5N5QMS2_9AGAM|nr:NudC domain containing protein [Ceratobasidium theobromae]